MFCYQCEQASNGKGCTKVGVCGKDPEVMTSMMALLGRPVPMEEVRQGVTGRFAEVFQFAEALGVSR